MGLEFSGSAVGGKDLEISGPEHSPHPCFPVTFWSSDNTNSRNQLKRELPCHDSRWPTGWHFTTVLWHVTGGVPLSDPKILMGALPFVKQINYSTRDCHILEAYWHNWDFNLHFALYLFKRVKRDPGRAQYNSSKGRKKGERCFDSVPMVGNSIF